MPGGVSGSDLSDRAEGVDTRLPVPGLPGVRFRQNRLEVGTVSLELLSASAADVLSKSPPNGIPYWSVAWPAGIALGRVLAERVKPETTVLELGAGVGVSGLCAAAAGARVTLSDNEPDALRLIGMNARRNRLAVQGVTADWRWWPLSSELRFDLIIGSDITYEPAAFDALLSVLRLAAPPPTEVWLTDPGRLMTTAFQQRATQAGWRWDFEELSPVGRQSVFLYRLRQR